jgi:hypothetical protein
MQPLPYSTRSTGEALVSLVSECGGDGEWADRVAYLANGKLGKLQERPGEVLLQRQVFSHVFGLFLCFGSDNDLYRADQNVLSGFNCRRTRVDDKGRLLEIKQDNEFSCKQAFALRATARQRVLETMDLQANLLSIDQNHMFKCVVLTCITAVSLVVQEVVVDRVGVPSALNVGQVAYLYIAATRSGVKAPQFKFVYRADLSKEIQRANLVATLDALLHRMRKITDDFRIHVWVEA